ncbi:MAG: hypothetical protein RLY14_1710, partial [Planctomycetota bacterium]
MGTENGDLLRAKRCVPCEGGVEACSIEEARKLMEQLNQWVLSDDGKRISKTWKLKNFVIG